MTRRSFLAAIFCIPAAIAARKTKPRKRGKLVVKITTDLSGFEESMRGVATRLQFAEWRACSNGR